VLVRQLPSVELLVDESWPEAMLLLAGLLVIVSSLARQISLQNALAAAGIVGLVGGAAHWASYVTGVPFGPLQFPHAFGHSPFQEWFFVPAVIWTVVLLSARGVARLLLEPGARNRNHGWHLLGLSVLLVVVMAMALEPYASSVHRYWLWGETRLPVTWQGVPLSCLFAWGVVSVIASFAAAPLLINKHPRPAPPAREPAWIWAMTSGLITVATALHGLWPASAVAAANGALAVGVDLVTWRRRSRSSTEPSRSTEMVHTNHKQTPRNTNE
jgi:hypothetical protein